MVSTVQQGGQISDFQETRNQAVNLFDMGSESLKDGQ
jgi:hypothetical protein